MTKTAAKTFTATLEKLRINLGWVIAFVPFDVKKAWGKGGRPKVRGTINGFEFRSSLFPTREGRHFILVNKQMQEGAGLVPLRGGKAGMRGLRGSLTDWQEGLPSRQMNIRQAHGAAALGAVVQFRIELDFEERAVPIPAELKRLLDEDRKLRRWYDALNYSIRKYFAYLITGVKSGEARVRRAEQIAECLLQTMEAERELPPALEAAFAEDTRAMKGWKLMSPIQRRGHLMGIFYYRNPTPRAKRIGKAMEEAARMAERQSKGKNQRSNA